MPAVFVAVLCPESWKYGVVIRAMRGILRVVGYPADVERQPERFLYALTKLRAQARWWGIVGVSAERLKDSVHEVVAAPVVHKVVPGLPSEVWLRTCLSFTVRVDEPIRGEP